MGADLGRLADQGKVDIGDGITGRAHEADHVFEKLPRTRAAPLRIAGREVSADIPVPDRAKHGVGDGVERNISVGMTGQPLVMRDLHSAQPQFFARFETVNVETLSDAESGACGHVLEILGKGDFFQPFVTIDQRN